MWVQDAHPIASANRRLGPVTGCRILQRAANRHRWTVTGRAPGSACLFSAGFWRRCPTMDRLDSQPAATRSKPLPNTMGMVVVANLAAAAAAVLPVAAITATLR